MRIKVVKFDDNWKNFLSYLENWKKDNLENFCLTKCDAKCCKEMEHSGVSEEQIRLVFNLSKKDSLFQIKNRYGDSMIKKDENGKYYTDMCYGIFCPSLNEKNQCNIYKNPLKPKYCDDFPFYYSEINGTATFEMEKCPATLSLDLTDLKKAAKKNNINVAFIKKITDV